MKRFLLAAFLIAAPLGGCTAASAVLGGSVASAAPAQVNVAKKALTAAHEVHRVTADFLVIAANTNLCHAKCAHDAKDYLDQSEAALVAADKLIVLGDAIGVEAKIAAATSLIADVNNLVGKK